MLYLFEHTCQLGTDSRMLRTVTNAVVPPSRMGSVRVIDASRLDKYMCAELQAMSMIWLGRSPVHEVHGSAIRPLPVPVVPRVMKADPGLQPPVIRKNVCACKI